MVQHISDYKLFSDLYLIKFLALFFPCSRFLNIYTI